MNKKSKPEYLVLPWDSAITREIVFSQAPGINEIWNVDDKTSNIYYLPLTKINTSISISSADLVIIPDSKQVYKNGKELHCTHTCYALLFRLIANGDNVVLRDNLYSIYSDNVESNTISHDISRVRKLIGTTYQGVPYIRTIKGMGYAWNFSIEKSVEKQF